MKIFYDGLIFSLQECGGINRYFSSVISRLPTSVYPVLSTTGIRARNFPAHPNLRTRLFSRFAFRPGRVSYWLEQYYFRFAEISSRADVYHPTFYRQLSRRPPTSRTRPLVITFWDILHLLYPETLDPTGEWSMQVSHAIKEASAICCISECSRRDLVDRYGVSESKLHLTPLASELSIEDVSGDEPVPERPYFLYVGSRQSYKNVATLLRAFRELCAIRRDVILAFVGAPWTKSEAEELRALGIFGSVVNLGQVSDSYLAALYANSVAFVLPSRYEGFGIPLVEAMACNAAVVAANTSSIPEVVDTAALLFSPDSSEELTESLRSVLDSESLRRTLIARGRDRAKRFAWEATAEKTFHVYQSLL